MKFKKCIGTLVVIEGRLYEILELYGHPRGSLGVVYMRFWKCMGTLGVVYMKFVKCMGTLGVKGGHLYKIWEVYVNPRGL